MSGGVNTECNLNDLQTVIYDDLDLKNFPMNFDVNVNNVFTRKDVLVAAMSMIVLRGNFEFRVQRSSKTRYTIVCLNVGCCWIMRASVCSSSNMWVIRTFVKEHNCYGSSIVHKHKQASSSLISKCIKDDFRGSMAEKISAVGVVEIMKSRYKVDTSYFKAWKGRAEVLKELRGDYEKSYSHLPIIGDLIVEKNPGIFDF